MNVDEIDTVLLVGTRSPTDSTKANLAAKLHTNRQRQTGIRNSQVCKIVTFLPL